MTSHTLTLDLPSCLSPERQPGPWVGVGITPGGSTGSLKAAATLGPLRESGASG